MEVDDDVDLNLDIVSLNIWAGARDFDTYPHQRAVKVKARQSLCCSHTRSMGVDEGSDQNFDLLRRWILEVFAQKRKVSRSRMLAHMKNEFAHR